MVQEFHAGRLQLHSQDTNNKHMKNLLFLVLLLFPALTYAQECTVCETEKQVLQVQVEELSEQNQEFSDFLVEGISEEESAEIIDLLINQNAQVKSERDEAIVLQAIEMQARILAQSQVDSITQVFNDLVQLIESGQATFKIDTLHVNTIHLKNSILPVKN